MDAGLEPGRSYSYTAYRQSVYNTALIDSSAPVTLTTLDTTSHDFTWTIDTLGSYGSYFNDVAIIDENNIWAVGIIETDSGEYNAARWDGEYWQFVRIAPQPFLFAPLTAIRALSENNIWVAGTAPMQWTGNQWQANTTYPTTGWIHAIWGSSPEDVYFVGDHGSIVHYDGSGFTRLESGTDIDLRGVFGSDDGEYIFFQGYHGYGYSSVLLQLHNKVFTFLYLSQTLYPGPTDFGKLYSSYLGGSTIISSTKAGVWEYNYLTRESVLIPDSITHSGDRNVMKIIGNNTNDYILAGNWWKLIHYNGVDYHYDDQIVQIIGEGGSSL